MKKLILILFIAGITFQGYSQAFNGFFKPVSKDLFAMHAKAAGEKASSVWLVRPSMAITAVQLTWNKDQKKFDAAPLSSAGPGIGFRHYANVNGEPYNDIGINLIALLGYSWTEADPVNYSVVGTVNLWEYFNFGGGYNITLKTPMILTGVVVKF